MIQYQAGQPNKKNTGEFIKKLYRICYLTLVFLAVLSLFISPALAQTDVTSSITLNRGRPFYDYANLQTYSDISLTNNSDQTFNTPVWLVIDSITTPNVNLADPDGYTQDNKPYIDYSNLLGDGRFNPSETSSSITIRFNNPQRLRFGFTTKVLVKEEVQAILESLSVEPASITLSSSGATWQLTVTGTYSDGTTKDLTAASTGTIYTSDNPDVATVSQDGLVTAEPSNGTAIVTATNTGISASATVEVIIDLTPPDVTITSPTDGDILTNVQVTVEGTVQDDSPIKSLTVNGESTILTGSVFTLDLSLLEGTNTITATATDTYDNIGSDTISVTVDTTPPVITIDSPTDGSSTNSTPITVTGSMDDATATVQVNGVTVPVSNGNFTAEVPLVEGENVIIATATDPAGLSDSAQITVTMLKPNQPPSMDLMEDQTINEGNTLEFSVSGADPDGDPLTYTCIGLPTGASFEPSTRTFSWTTGYDQEDTYTVTFTATDPGGLSDSIQVAIIVNNTNRQPVLEPITDQTIAEGDTLTFTLTGADPDQDPLTYTVIGLPPGAGFDPSTQTFSWAPTYDQLGTYTVEFAITDPEGLSDSIQVDMTVITLNQAPSLEPIAEQTIPEGDTLTFQVTGSDTDQDPLTYNASDLPPGAGFNTSTQTFSWAPTHEQYGAYDVTFSVTDGKESAQQQVRIIVTDVNRSPKITTNELPPGKVDQVYKGAITAQDDDWDPISYTLTQSPPAMTINTLDGSLSWRPGISDIGDHPVSVVVDDGRGGTDSRQYTLTVPDTIPPGIFLNAPKEAIPGKAFTVTAQVADNIAVSSVTLEADGHAPVELSNPPYETEIILPPVLAIGSSFAVHGRAIDTSHNESEDTAVITIVDAPDMELPVVNINAPPEATQGETIRITASASDNAGISSITFLVDNDPIGTVSDPNPSMEYQVPADVPIGSTLVFMAEAEDFSGNRAYAEATITVTDTLDTTAPEVTLSVTPFVEADALIPVCLMVTDDTGVAKIDIYVNHIFIKNFTEIQNKSFDECPDIPQPPGLEPNMDVLIEAAASDHSGNETTKSQLIRITKPIQGVIKGEVYNDTTGLPLEGAQVTFQKPNGTEIATLTNSNGQYTILAEPCTGSLIITKSGFTQVDRTETEVLGNKGTEVFDARLTPLNLPASTVSGVLGATLNIPFGLVRAGFVPVLESKGVDITALSPAEIALHIPSGALNEDKDLAFTQISPQGLQGLLPAGWSPIGVVDIAPRDVSFNNPAFLSMPNMLECGQDASIILATWDEKEGVWRALSDASISADGTSFTGEIMASGQYAFLAPDLLPQTPLHPSPGEILQGISPVSVPEEVSTLISPQPKIIFYKPGVKSDVGLRVTPDTATLSSGAHIWAEISEEYNFYSGEKLNPMPYSQDIVLFSLTESSLFASYPVTPSEKFEALSLEKGIITVDVVAPGIPGELAVIGPDGGVVAAPTGETMTVPAGAVADLIPVEISILSEEDLGIDLPEGFDFLGGISISFAGNILNLPATLSVSLPSTYTDQGQILIIKVLEVMGNTHLALVGAGEVQEGEIVSLYDLMGDGSVRFEGIIEGGRYLFIQTEITLGFAGGKIFGTTGEPLPGALVACDTTPIVAVSFGPGDYISAVPTGDFTLTALDTEKMDTGTTSGTLLAEGAFVPINITMQEAPPIVISVSPEDGAENVPLLTPIKVQFSEPLNPMTVTSDNVALTSPDGPVTGTISLRSNNTLVTFRPVELLAANTNYNISVSEHIEDMAGYTLGSPFTSGFTSLDTIPPLPPAGAISATIPDEDGKTTISATQGTAGTHDTVFIINKTKGTSTPVLIEPDGSFSAIIGAGIIDKIVISITDPAGNETAVPVDRFQNPDGSVAIGPEGGQVEAENGVILDIPPGAFPNGGIIRITALSENDIGVSAGPDFPFVAGFELECSVEPEIYLNASAPVPEGTRLDATGIVAEVVEAFGQLALSIVDTAKVINGRLTTSSPPCVGIKEFIENEVKRYAMFLNDHEQMRSGIAMLSLLFPYYRDLVARLYSEETLYFPFIAPSCIPLPPEETLKLEIIDIITREVIDFVPIEPVTAGGLLEVEIDDPDDTTPPTVIEVKPIHKILDVYNKNIWIYFSEPIRATSVETITLISDESDDQSVNEVYEGKKILSEDNTILVFRPNRPLPLGGTYRLNIEQIEDYGNNHYEGPPIRFSTLSPKVIFPTESERLDHFKISMDLRKVNPDTIPQYLWFTDVDFVSKSPDESPDGRWHTDLVAIHADEYWGYYRLFCIDVSEPTIPKVTGGFKSSEMYFQKRLRLFDDVYIVPREDASSDPKFWKKRKLYFLKDEPSIHICGDPDSEEIYAWQIYHKCNEDPERCGVFEGGCGDLALVTTRRDHFTELRIYDVTDPNEPVWFSFRKLSDNSVLHGFPRHKEAPEGSGFPRGISMLLTMDITHGNRVNSNTYGVYVAVPNIGLELVDLKINIPGINYWERREPCQDGPCWESVESLKIKRDHTYYKDVAVLVGKKDGSMVQGKVVAIAGDYQEGSNTKTIEVFKPDLTAIGKEVLKNFPNWLETVTDFPVNIEYEDLPHGWLDLAFVSGEDGGISKYNGISVFEIPHDNESPKFISFIETPSGVVTKHIQVDKKGMAAYVGASGIEEGGYVDHLLVVNLSQPFNSISPDNDNDKWDDRIIGKVPLRLPGHSGPVQLHGFRLHEERGLIYAAINTGGEQGLAIIKVRECPDLGVDFKARPKSAPTPIALEKKALQKVLHQCLSAAQSECNIYLDSITIIEHGKGSCLWANDCYFDYQPGESGHKFVVFLPYSEWENRDCVIAKLYEQVISPKGDPIPIELGKGVRVTFEDIEFFPMVREEFEEAALNILPIENDMGLGRQLLLLKWLIEGAYVDVPGWNQTGKDLREILNLFKKPMEEGLLQEPSHILRLEGYEWAKLQEARLLDSGALIRIHGEPEPGTTLRQMFKEDLKVVARAVIQAVLARIVANEEGNRLAAQLAENIHQGVSHTSFANYVTSVAEQTLQENLGLFTSEDIQDKVYDSYMLLEGSHTISTEGEANAFIAMALQFIREVGSESGEPESIYMSTIGGLDDEMRTLRTANMTEIEERIVDLELDGKKHIIPRVFNNGFQNTEDVWVRMYGHDEAQGYIIAEKKVILEAGSYIHIDTRKETQTQPDGTIVQRKVPFFVLKGINQTDASQRGWISFLVGLPEKRNIPEPDRENNWAKLYYYVLNPVNPFIPSLPGKPDLPIDNPKGNILESDPLCGCAEPKLDLILKEANSDNLYDINLYINECVDIDVKIVNHSAHTIEDVKLFSDFSDWEKSIKVIDPGEEKNLILPFCAEEEIEIIMGKVWAEFSYICKVKDEDKLGKYAESSPLIINVFRVDLEMQGLSESTEENPGAFIALNKDDDNENGKADKDDVPESSTDSLIIDNENDLAIVSINNPLGREINTPKRGTLSLEATSGGNNIKIWDSPYKGKEIHLPKPWNLENDYVPYKLFVEGVNTSSTSRDVSLKLNYIGPDGTTHSDSVKITVIDLGLTIHKPAVIDPGEMEIAGNEEYTKGVQTFVNLDNDDSDGYYDTGDMDKDVYNEDEIIKLLMELRPADLNQGIVKLEAICGGHHIKVWTAWKKDAQYDLGFPLDVPHDFTKYGSTLTRALWVEGISPHKSQRETRLKLIFTSKISWNPWGLDAIEGDKVALTIIGIDSIEWEGKNNSIDDNNILDLDRNWPGQEVYNPSILIPPGALRVFPGSRPEGILSKPGQPRDRVNVNVYLTVDPIEPVNIYFKSLDVDDPTSDTFPIDDDDPNSPRRDPDLFTGDEIDNRGTTPARAGKIINSNDSGILTLSFDSKYKTFEFQTTMQPGDNFRIVGNGDINFINVLCNDEISLGPNNLDKQRIFDSTINNIREVTPEEMEIPDINHYSSKVLTIWRFLHIECDSMEAPTDDDLHVKGAVTDFISDTNKASEVNKGVCVSKRLRDGSRDMDGIGTRAGNGRFENGKLLLGSEDHIIGPFPVYGNGGYTVFFKIDPNSPSYSLLPLRFYAEDNDLIPDTIEGEIIEISKDHNKYFVYSLNITKASDTSIEWSDFIGGSIEVAGGYAREILDVNGTTVPPTITSRSLNIPFDLVDDDQPYNERFKLPRFVNSDLMQESDDQNKNLWACAYIRPVWDGGGSLSNNDLDVPFMKNLDSPDIKDLYINLLREIYRNRDTGGDESPYFWIAYIVSAYENKSDRDSDPDDEWLVVGLQEDRYTCAFIFLETIRDAGVASGWPEKGIEEGGFPAYHFEAQIVVHELGHQLGLLHPHGNDPNAPSISHNYINDIKGVKGIMTDRVLFLPPELEKFSDISLDRLRRVIQPVGMPH